MYISSSKSPFFDIHCIRKISAKDLARASERSTGWRRLIGSLILQVIFLRSDLYLVALLWKTICNVRDPMSLRHPVRAYTPSTIRNSVLQCG